MKDFSGSSVGGIVSGKLTMVGEPLFREPTTLIHHPEPLAVASRVLDQMRPDLGEIDFTRWPRDA